MERLRETRLTRLLGIAPGPANGFTLDIILNFERFGALVDWAMIILNPLEPWPGALCLPAAEKYGVDVITRVVDYGGLFHDDVKPGHAFGKQDHRAFRPAGWVEAGFEKIEKLRPIAERHGLTLLQFACIWNLSHRPVRSVVPTLIQETGPDAKPIEEKIDELAALPEIELSEDEREEVRRIGDNRGCMELKGANPAHTGEPLADRWAVSNDLAQIAQRWRIDPACDLAYTHAVSAPS
jgi:aryl-alcohol dehydrogenase-like predicted oxidoreductase